MKNFVTHFIQNHLPEIASKSLLHCHCRGVHSIVLLESPEKTIRLYISEPGSGLWKNDPQHFQNGKNMSIAFHPHHCNLTLECVAGSIFNWEMKPSDTGLEMEKFIYRSGITDGKIGFESVGKEFLQTKKITELGPDQSIALSANDIHTIYCDRDQWNAWFVYEGKEDENYRPFCWSNADLSNLDSKGLYEKPSEKQIIDLLTKINLLDKNGNGQQTSSRKHES